MLGSLTGTVAGRLGQRILIQVAGVGYWVHTGSWQPSGQVTTYLYHHVREEASDLYGFESLETLALYENLISVSGVGPKAGLALLSLGEPSRIARAIVAGDIAFLSLAPGIGKKVAEKTVLELKSKLLGFAQDTDTTQPNASIAEDLLAALEALGYRPADVQPIVAKIPADATTLEVQIKWVLKQLVR